MFQPAITQQQKTNGLRTVEIFDPPMCCPSGLCGPVLDQMLLDINEMILDLQSKGIIVIRYQMASEPNAFLNNPEVMILIKRDQMDALPITAVNGSIIKSGAYPSLSDVNTALTGKG